MYIYTVTDFHGNRYEVAADSPESAAREVEAAEGVTSVCVEDCCGVCY